MTNWPSISSLLTVVATYEMMARYRSSDPKVVVILLALGLVAEVMGVRGCSKSNRLQLIALQSLLAFAARAGFILSLYFLVDRIIDDGHVYSAIGEATAWLVSATGEAVSNVDGRVMGNSISGWLSVRADPARTSVIPMIVCATIIALESDPDRSGRGWRLLSITVWTISVIVLKFAAMVATIMALPEPLAGGWPSRLVEDIGSLDVLPWICLLSFPYLARTPPPTSEGGELRNGRIRASILALAVAVLIGFVSEWIPGGPSKRGRVLIDDSLSGIWEQSGRILDENWYGDMSTYSFAAAAELVGYHFSLDVNTARWADSQMLSDYDVLLLKVPQSRLTQSQIVEVKEWVRRGGGLVLVGDHTDLFGSSTALNDLCKEAGIEFQFDGVMDIETGGFSEFGGGSAHPLLDGVDYLQFMTSCSLAVRGAAVPVLSVDRSYCQIGDYGNSSNFGEGSSDPSSQIGRAVVLAESRLGRGRIVAFADSTVLSSFAIHSPGRARLLLNCINFANRSVGALGLGGNWLSTVSAALAMLLLCLHRRSGSSVLRDTIGVLLIPAFLAGQVGAKCSNRMAYALPDPIRALPELRVVLDGGYIPPVLGGLGGAKPEWCYDTLYTELARVGVISTQAPPPWNGDSSTPQLWLGYCHGPTLRQLNQIDVALRGGARMLICVRNDHSCPAALDALLIRYSCQRRRTQPDGPHELRGVGVQLVASSDRAQLYSIHVGRGKLMVLVGLETFSRANLGHSFDYPNENARLDLVVLRTAVSEVIGTTIERRTFRILEQGND